MKNIHVLPTDRPSKLCFNKDKNKFTLKHKLPEGTNSWRTQNIYITSDEEIKKGDYVVRKNYDTRYLGDTFNNLNFNQVVRSAHNCKPTIAAKKIILTTDQDLIKDGVQAIDDDFLKWFVTNPSCEKVEVKTDDVEQPRPLYLNGNHKGERVWIEQYKVIIPKEELKQEHCDNCNNKICCCIIMKQETLEEAAEKYSSNELSKLGFLNGAKWQQERSYSEEEAFGLCKEFAVFVQQKKPSYKKQLEWFEQFKKK